MEWGNFWQGQLRDKPMIRAAGAHSGNISNVKQ